MSKSNLILESIPNQQRANKLIGKLFDITQPNAIYGKPITKGEYTIITASELHAGVGTGFGGGGDIKEKSDATGGESVHNDDVTSTGGGGGGGGGGSMARPVAAIIIGPNGVRIEPIVDATKIAIALFTALGSMMMALGRMQKSRKTN